MQIRFWWCFPFHRPLYARSSSTPTNSVLDFRSPLHEVSWDIDFNDGVWCRIPRLSAQEFDMFVSWSDGGTEAVNNRHPASVLNIEPYWLLRWSNPFWLLISIAVWLRTPIHLFSGMSRRVQYPRSWSNNHLDLFPLNTTIGPRNERSIRATLQPSPFAATYATRTVNIHTQSWLNSDQIFPFLLEINT